MSWVYASNAKPGIQINLMDKSYFIDYKTYLKRFAFDLMYYYLTFVVALNVVLGILISSFSNQRQISQQITYDLNNICYICGGKKDDFKKKNLDFEDHREKEHFLWDYFSYFIFLRVTDIKELNYNNSYAKNMVNSQNIYIFPVFDENQESEKDDFNEDLENLKYFSEEHNKNKQATNNLGIIDEE